MQDHGLVAEIHQRLGHAERQRPQAGAKASDENEGLHGFSNQQSSDPEAAATERTVSS